MSAQLPDGKRFYIGVARGTGNTDTIPLPLVVGIGGVAVVVVAAVLSFSLYGVKPVSIATTGSLMAVALIGFGIVWWLNKRFQRSRPEPVAEWLGVDASGISWTTTPGTTHYPWDGIGGVRIHCVVNSGYGMAAPGQTVLLDLLGPVAGPTATAAQAAAGPLLVRLPLRMASGHEIHLGPRLAREVGSVIRRIRPDLWRGYTRDSGLGYVEFHSFEQPVVGTIDNLRQPTWDDFGGGPPR